MLAAISDQSDQQFVFIMDEWDAVLFINGKVFIPNKELMLKYEELLQNEKILCVGISYDKETKEHQCKIEMLSNHS